MGRGGSEEVGRRRSEEAEKRGSEEVGRRRSEEVGKRRSQQSELDAPPALLTAPLPRFLTFSFPASLPF
ncbi:hypothetical protein PSMK_26620 [Phycisphaera mikurensis NBRC 102666]|uniref:Uncharacterized protein n=1 Tax=Phycisphaera mikurensis (strain NBRC 102666 / KCTC 22515 / FYK2301M01) TaxID=1142394 RepID=I0IHT3_PHYMF|nr:hypothetical protein PSMK_26620 [Phycisphaera mikurensis NBRC 102666]